MSDLEETARQIIYYTLGVIEALMGVRFFLRFFGASPTAGFYVWIVNITDPLVQPFIGIFPDISLGKAAALDFSLLFAMTVYGIGAYTLVALVGVLMGTKKSLFRK